MYTLPSLLPSLYDWSFWVPFLFRLFLSYQLYREAKRLMRGTSPEIIHPDDKTLTEGARRTLSWMMVGLSACFFFGIAVQIIAVFTALLYLFRVVQISKHPEGKGVLRELLLLSALISFSLLFLGPGPYAVDLPL